MNNEAALQLLQKIHAGADDSFRKDDNVVSQIAILRSWVDSEDPMKLAYLYDPDDDRFYDRLYPIHEFLEECKRIMDLSCEESYFSINSYWRKNKATDDIRHLNAFVLDFDYYKMQKFKDLDPPDMYNTYLKDTLPFPPTAVIDSGRGLYVLYVFQHCSIKRLELYRCIYKQFLELYKAYGMDAKATNVTQVIRIPGSYNVKADKTVEILEFNDTNYQLTDFCSLLPYSLEQTKKFKENSKHDEKKDNHTSVAAKQRARKGKNLINDLKRLIVIRNKAGIVDGYREQLIYIALEKLLWAGYSNAEALKVVRELNNTFKEPLPDSALETQCMPSRIYYHSHSIIKILNKLDITDEEQTHLQILQSRKHQDLHRKRLRNKHPLLNRTNKEIQLLKRRTKVIELKKEGKRNVDIANSLGVDKSTITNDLKYIEKNKSEFIKILGLTLEHLIVCLSDDKLLRSITYDEAEELRTWLKTGILVVNDP